MAKQFRKSAAAFSDVPYAFVKRRLAQRDFEPSFLAGLIRKNEEQPGPGSYEETVIKWAAASFYGGGSDTVYIYPCHTAHQLTLIHARLYPPCLVSS